jgi:hypothetical protein
MNIIQLRNAKPLTPAKQHSLTAVFFGAFRKNSISRLLEGKADGKTQLFLALL